MNIEILKVSILKLVLLGGTINPNYFLRKCPYSSTRTAVCDVSVFYFF